MYTNIKLVPNLNPDEQLSDDCIWELMEQFVGEFTERYPTCGPPLCMSSLSQALEYSLYNQNNVYAFRYF